MLKARYFVFVTLVVALLISVIWQYYYGRFVGDDIRFVSTKLKDRNHRVIDPVDESDIYDNCSEMGEVYLIPEYFVSLIVLKIDEGCKVTSVRMGWRK